MSELRKIVVTGGRGKAGRAVIEDLSNSGFETLEVDLVPFGGPSAPTRVADMTDLGQVMEVLHGADAVVHLAAIRAPGMRTDAETFRINSLSTYYVFSAAMQLGLRRVVWASSETLIGLPFLLEGPRYAPIDEDHPRLPESHYALSKLVGETMAGEFNRWHEIPFIGLRISNIMDEEDYERFPGFWTDPTIRAWNLWGYVDARDVAAAVRGALMADINGAEAFLIAAADTCMNRPSHGLMEEVYPEVPIRKELGKFETLLAIDKARTVLDYKPRVSWRDYVDSADKQSHGV